MTGLNRSEGAALTIVPSCFYDVVAVGKDCQTSYSGVKAPWHSLEAIPVARTVQTDVATVEVVANVRELLLQLCLALTWFGRIRKQLTAKPRKHSQAVTS